MTKLKAIQGDIVFEVVDKVPTKAKKRKGNVLVYGETTGHMHAVNNADIFELGPYLYINPLMDTEITHQEHNIVPIEKGQTIRVRRQREYQSKDMTRLVVD